LNEAAMGCLGVHFALDERTVRKLKSFRTTKERLAYLREEIEEDYFENHGDWLQETGKAWDGIHRALTDGKFDWNNGPYPLNAVIMNGEDLYRESGHILSLKDPSQVRDIAAALRDVAKVWLRQGYDLITPANCDWDTSEEDWDYTWFSFQELRDFYQRAAAANRYVLFSADQ
jgi:Domain of unknown function (DUF1877)